MKGSRFIAVVCLVVFGFLVGCGPESPPKPVPMGTAAPAFGSGGKYDTLEGFLDGMWCQSFDSSGDTEYIDYWQFKSDGTFVYSKIGSEHKFAGTWKPSGKGVWLTYETYDGDTIQALRERMQKEAEGGTQAGFFNEDAMSHTLTQIQRQVYLELSEEKREMFFTDPGSTTDLSVTFSGGGGGLVRIEMKKEDK